MESKSVFSFPAKNSQNVDFSAFSFVKKAEKGQKDSCFSDELGL
jgi:hypothetical protein